MKAIQAALYARVSSDQQVNAQTVASQLATLRERMVADGCAPQAELEFIDEGWSGATLLRPSLERLRDGAAFGVFGKLYVHSPDRLARKYAYQVLLIDELQRAGVEIVFLNHAMGRTPEDDLLLQVQGMVAEYERAKILERSRRGKRHKAQSGQVGVLSGAPYGYRYVSLYEGGGCARYEVAAQEAQVVRQIFEWIGRERTTIGQVCRRLEGQCIASPKGKPTWDRTTVWGILKNPAYCGQAAYGKTKVAAALPCVRPQRNQRRRQGKSTVTVTPDNWLTIAVPEIVDANLFAAVQAQLQENRVMARTRHRGACYLLQGLVVCKLCGYAFYGKPVSTAAAKGGQRHYSYYRCIGADAYRFGGQRVCMNTQVRTDCLDQAVWQEVQALLNDPQRLKQEYDRRLQAVAKPVDNITRTGLEKQLGQCLKGIGRVIDAYADGYLDKPDFEPKISRLKARQHDLERQIEQLDDASLSYRELQLIIGRLEEFGMKVKEGLGNMLFAEKRELIRTLVKRVEIDREQVNVVFRVEPTRNDSISGNSLQDCGRRD